MFRWILVVLIAATAVVALASDTVAPGRAPEVLLVTVNAGERVDSVAMALGAQGFAVQGSYDDLHALTVAGDPSRVGDIEAIHGVRYVEPVVAFATADAPSDPLFTNERAYLDAVKAPQAWDIEQGKPDIVVAVVDTGVDIRHPDLQSNIWFNPREVANNGVDDDGNGCVDDLNGCAFVSDSSPGCHDATNGFVRDDIGHGTFVAGVIAAAANGTGMVGVARGVRIMPVKVLDCYGAGDSVATARGILYAARNGARVINLSLGGLFDAQVVRDAVSEATGTYGALVVAAAGNDGVAGVAFPARIPEVLAVGATDSSASRRSIFSSYGPEVDVVAVGEGVIGTLPPTRCYQFLPCFGAEPYAAGKGTSFSAPQVSGLAALMFSMRPTLSPSEVTDIIKGTSTPLPPGDTPGWAGAGRINMFSALTSVQSNQPSGDPCTIESVLDGESFTCVGGRHVRMLQMEAPALGQCGGEWARAAAQYIFLTPGRTVSLRYDAARSDEFGRTLAVPIWRGGDGYDYNLAMVMVYVGMARAADVGAGNFAYHDWSFAAQQWASVAQWNMWEPGKTFNGGC